MELLLSELDRQQLCDFIRVECANDRHFQQRFLALGNGILPSFKPADYRARIMDVIEDFGDRHGFVEYNKTSRLNRAICEIIDEADMAIYNDQWDVAQAILDGVATSGEDILYCGDDSAGDLGDILNYCFQKWHILSSDELLPEAKKSELFELCLTHFSEGCLKEFDWWWDWIQMSIQLADDEEKLERIIQELDKVINIKGDEWGVNYNRQVAQRYKLEVMSRRGTPGEQLEFMYENVGNPDFRRRLLQIAWDKGDYKEVLRLAVDGAAYDSDYAGLVNDWRKWELKVYRQIQDCAGSLRLYQYFFFNGGRFGEEAYSMENMYSQMKSIVPKEEWKDFVVTLLKEAASSRSYFRMLFIYSQEKMWDRYMGYLRKSPAINELDEAPEEVWELYKDELVQLYAACVRSFFKRASSRNAYCEGVSLLRKLINYGGRTEVDSIIQDQKNRTPRRPALIDELSKLEKELLNYSSRHYVQKEEQASVRGGSLF